MKNKRRPAALVLSLVALNPTIREAVSQSVQRQLFALGYRWLNQTVYIPQHTNAEVLRICSPDWSILDITYCNGPQRTYRGGCVFFTHDQIEEFIAYARDAVRVVYRKRGVNVTISPNGVVLNADALLTEVALDANAIAKKYFGK